MSRTNSIVTIGFLGFLALCVSAGLSLAEENIFQIDSAIRISEPDGANFRLLFRPDIGLPDTLMTIDRATLELTVSPASDDSTFAAIRVCPIIVNWNQDDAAWEAPWATPGGDFDNVNYAEYAVNLTGSQTINIDVTDLCMRWADGQLPYFGFLIGVSESSLAPVQFLSGSDGNGPWGTLRISYTSIHEE